ncbi:uncharacterized protein NFIA_057700 [Aspergillus fischeri NRRL 181]|uniref:C6 transcription factor n=1 Tax=Neosartorya fischeri (strain ATCC 1020 / DSM 3700 / CBS 544.65 / FGSC A1164 / JCM 1740 / NRRL 181 / WB 181) TaxID=331117 RepID=A1DNP9_NEOFI|nr:conserved hypothetical protein [Aspergillus fischeri NRRL 181]EAW16420.1 conserved hypothetical protein [Aspergillus fischeri NRRL 181]
MYTSGKPLLSRRPGSIHFSYTSAKEYSGYSLEYQSAASPEFRRSLEQITEDNCGAVFAFSVITLVLMLTATAFDEDGPGSALETVFSLSEFLKGVRSICLAGGQWLSKSSLGDYIQTKPMLVSDYEDIRAALDRLRVLYEAVVQQMDETKSTTYGRAIDLLGECLLLSRGMSLRWLILVGEEFFCELEKSDPMGLVIFLHWAAILDALKDEWWALDIGKRLVEEVSAQADQLAGPWAETVLWAKIQVGLEMPTRKGASWGSSAEGAENGRRPLRRQLGHTD